MLYTDEEIRKRKKRESKIKKRLNTLVCMLLIPLLIYNISIIIQAIINPEKTPSFFGIKTYVIISGSMQPELEIGDIVIVKEVDRTELGEGDIISFRQGQSVITHRISKIILNEQGTIYKTRGDNNNTEDSGTINEEEIEGKVIGTIPFLGKIALMLQGKISILVIIIAFYIYLVYSEKANKKRKERRQKRLEYEKR